jgi:subtilase family serine protease
VSDNAAKVLNMSWGAPECGSTSQGFADAVFQLGVVQGQTFVSSSGDNGAYPCEASKNGVYGDKSLLSAEYPSSSPYVVAVGGTSLVTSSSNAYVSESAWPYSGGGISSSESTPAWQPASFTHRHVPDLAFDADWTSSPVLFYLTASATSGVAQDGYYLNGGTSLSAPLFVGAWARLESSAANGIGFAAPAIYAYASSTSNPLPLHDVVTGSNGGYSAVKGWDAATGWGSFDIQAVSEFIARTPGFIDASHP